MEKKERFIMLVTVDIPPEKERAWNDWYNNQHVPDILKCPGFKRVGRFERLQGNGTRYVTIYELDRPDVRESEEFARVRGWYQFADSVIEPRISVYREFLAADAE
jgi:antibiotic biosynthesis monooxygenase (ABM) superfamily enzyme